MTAECNQFVFGFHPQKRRDIRAQFDGGAITSDGGGLLLREVEKRIGILHQFAACFTDYRNPDLIEHPVKQLVAQRVYGLALGYEDLNDHEELRNDPLLAVLVEKEGPGSQVLAGKSTLNRLELTKETASRKERYKKIVLDHGAVDRLLVEVFLQAHREEPKEIILDLDATDDPLHGKQRGDMENRIKEQLMLFSDRTSTHYLRSNQLRLYFSSIAYVLLQMLRRLGLAGTELAQAQCSTIRLKLLKIGALIRITVRKVWVSLAGGYPYVALFQQIYEKLCAVPLKY